MRILYDEQIFSNQAFGGISRYFTELARELQVIDGVDARILSPLCTNTYAKTLPIEARIGVPFPRFELAERYIRFFNRRCGNSIIKRFKPDILHQTYYPPKDPCPLPSAKVVTTVYDMIHEIFHQDFADNDRTSEFKIRAVEKADHVICISENTRKDLIRFSGIDKAKTSVVHLGVDHHSYKDLPAIHENVKPYLLYVGLRSAYKNFEGALRAYAATTVLRTEYDFICYGGGKFGQQEHKLRTELNIPENQVRWIGGDDDVLGSLYQHAAAFIYPSLYEGFGIPPLEAMMQNCPVVSSNRSSIPEVLGNAAEFFDPEDIEEMGHAIVRVVSDPNRSKDLAALGTNHAKQFTWKLCARETLAIYSTLR